jgi:RNA polymerase sigma-70 factor (ECF subfamily)
MVGVSYPTAGGAEPLEAAVRAVVRAATHSAPPGGDRADPEPIAGDPEDIRRTQDGDPDAYRRLVERYQDHVGQILWRFSRDRSIHEELVQDVFVEAYLSLKTYHGRAPFGHWLARIATRVGYRYWKEKARQKATEPFSLEEWDQVAEDDQMLERLEPDRAADILHRLLAQLPPRDRLVLTMRYIEGCDVAETARRTGWTKTMVKVQALRARTKLKKLVERSEMELWQ